MKRIFLQLMIAALVVSGVASLLTGLENYTWAAVSQKIENVDVIEAVNHARISWETSQPSATKLFYSDNTNSYSTLIMSGTLTRRHQVTLQALDAGTPYYFKIVAESGINQVEQTGSFKTLGEKANLTVYQPYFTLLFEDGWRNINGVNPREINEPNGLDFYQTGFNGGALKLNKNQSYLQYSCENVVNGGFGTVTAWVAFDRFDKSAVIWQTNDSKYALYYEVGGPNSDFDRRLVARAGGNKEGEYPEVQYVIKEKNSQYNNWSTGDWHFIALTWEGKFSGKLALLVDGRRVGEAEYNQGGGCSSFRIGNNYRLDMPFTVGRIDELKVHQWAMSPYYVYENYKAYSYNPKFKSAGQVAGYNIRSFKDGKLLKAADGRIYVVSRGTKVHIADVDALKRYGSHPIINATEDELAQYTDGGEFNVWSRYPDGTLLKAYGKSTVYWIWDGEARPLFNEQVFNRYNNDWRDVIEVTGGELSMYPSGKMYR